MGPSCCAILLPFCNVADLYLAQMSRRMPARKRARSDYAGRQSAATRAMFANMYTSKKYPYSSYGRQYVPKGTYLSQAGSSYMRATPAQRAWRRANNYHGVGMYTGRGGFWKDLGRGWQRLAKSKLGRGVRHAFTRELGDLAETMVPGSRVVSDAALKAAGIGMYTGAGMYTGSGGYDTVKNELIAGGHATEGVMRFDAQNDEDAITISHSEYVMDVYAPPSGEKKTDIILPLNAGASKTFPMLSQIASNFEDFEIVQLGFTYKPSLSDWQTTNGQVGQVLIATNYNPMAEPWTSKQQLLAQTGSTSARTIDSTMHGVECDPSKSHNDGHYLVRTGPPRPDTDLNDYDHGFTQLSVVDTPSDHPNITLGELHVSYTIRLSKPRVWQKAGNIIPRDLFMRWNYDANTGAMISQGALATAQNTVMFIPPVNQYIARQSNMGSALSHISQDAQGNALPGAHKWFAITLPANLAGDFVVRVSGQVRFTNGFQEVIPVFQKLGDIRFMENMGKNLNSTPDNTPKYGPQLYPDNNYAYLISHEMTYIQSGTTESFSGELPFHAGVARDGQDNQIMFCISVTGSSPQSSATLHSLKIEITGLNTRLQWRQDGTNDKIIYEDSSKQIVTY